MAVQLIRRLAFYVLLLGAGVAALVNVVFGQEPDWLRWQAFEQVSKFDDTPIHSVGLSAAGPLLGAGALLRLRCDEGRPVANIFLMNMVGSNRTSGEVRYRIDAQASVTETLLVNEVGDALFFSSDEAARKFSRSLLGAKKLIMQIQPVGDPLYLGTFNVEGLAQISGPMRQACDW